MLAPLHPTAVVFSSPLSSREWRILPRVRLIQWKARKEEHPELLDPAMPEASLSVEFAITFPPDGDCSHEIKRRLLLGRKVMTNLAY